MATHIEQTIAALQDQLRRQESEAAETKRVINRLCKEAGLDPLYADAELTDSVSSIRADQFYGRPMATVIREYLTMRRAGNLGAATAGDIYAALARGGYRWETKNEENSKRGVLIALSKNPIFHRIPGSNAWGLSEWYPGAKSENTKKPSKSPRKAKREAQPVKTIKPSVNPDREPVVGISLPKKKKGGEVNAKESVTGRS